MSVIIRLQNLAWSANALDIRQFFRGLSIPEGGVHIVGGELGDAFIAFSTDEDARQAMMQDSGKIKEMKIKLLLSSRTEMQKVIEAARQQTLSLQSFMQNSAVGVTSSPQIVPIQQVIQQTQQQPRLSPVLDNKSKRDKDRDSEHENSKDRKDRRRSRSRSRGRDRSGGGRDHRRRRDRSRSRNRDRDRRDRGRRTRRDYSRSRSRSRDRDSSKRSAVDRRKDSHEDNDNNDVVCVGQFPKDKVASGKNMKVNSGLENGIWEIPPQTQMQQAAAMIIPGILNAGLSLQNPESRSMMRFGNNTPTQPTPLLPPNFSMNNLGNAQSHNLNPLLNSMSSSNLNSNLGIPPINLGMPRERQNWSGNVAESPSRITDMRFSRPGVFLSADNSGFNSQFRSNPRFNAPMMKNQEFDRRNTFPPSHDELSKSRYPSNNKNNPNGDKAGPCVEVRNMPLNTTYSDVRHAFQGLYIKKDGLKLINDTHGNRVGIAYIKFSKPEGKEKALGIPRYVRGSEVEVCPLDESIFDKAVDSYIPDRRTDEDDMRDDIEDFDSKPTCILITDLPSFTKDMDIAKLFQDWKINDLLITNSVEDSNGMSSCKAYVQFDKPEDAAASTKLMTLKVGSKTVMAVSIPDEVFIHEKKLYEESLGDMGNLDTCISIRGLPFHTIDRDVMDFLSDIGIVPKKIHMIFNKNATPMNSDSYCELNTHEEALRAMSKNGLPFGKTIPSIELISRSKMLDMLNSDTDMEFPFSSLPPLQDRTKLPPLTSLQNHQHLNNHNNNNNNANHRHQFHPGAPPPLSSLHHPPFHPPRFGNNPFNNAPPPRGGLHSIMNFPRPPLGILGNTAGNVNNSGNNSNGNNNNSGNNRLQSSDHVEGFGKPGCVLSLENVPFKADIDEIIEFFTDYDIKRENVIRRYNERGMPTGDAKVAFASPTLARRALRELRNRKVRDRTIYMKLV